MHHNTRKKIKNKVMIANLMQRCLCDVIHSQVGFWKNSNDITSPTHLVDIEEECFAHLSDLLTDKERLEFVDKLQDLYLFIRKFD